MALYKEPYLNGHGASPPWPTPPPIPPNTAPGRRAFGGQLRIPDHDPRPAACAPAGAGALAPAGGPGQLPPCWAACSAALLYAIPALTVTLSGARIGDQFTPNAGFPQLISASELEPTRLSSMPLAQLVRVLGWGIWRHGPPLQAPLWPEAGGQPFFN